MPLAILLLLTAAGPETLGHFSREGSAFPSESHSAGALTIRALTPPDGISTGGGLSFGLLKLGQDAPPPRHPELSPRIRAGFDTVQLRKSYQDCVRRAAREEPARSPSATFSSSLTALCGNEAAALRAAILRRERASPVASRLADEAVEEATDAALRTDRTGDQQ